MSEYLAYLKSLFNVFGEVQIRRMFGGHGVFYQGLMFALVIDDVLFLKVDDDLKHEFERNGLEPFSYNKKNKMVRLAYYQAPEEALEDPDELALWASKSYRVAVKANAGKLK